MLQYAIEVLKTKDQEVASMEKTYKAWYNVKAIDITFDQFGKRIRI